VEKAPISVLRPINPFKKAVSSLQEFGDEYVAVDHILLALSQGIDPVAKALTEAGLTEKPLKAAMKENSQKPENQ
jgi:ATP-dependent Clp protease ATP-binding subunit ClpA